MQVVINIDDKDYEWLKIKGKINEKFLNDYEKLIANGTPIPKGHGRLIDADEINLQDISPVDGFSVYGATAEDIDLAPTIIEADRSEKQI
jgi:hypothetical protein